MFCVKLSTSSTKHQIKTLNSLFSVCFQAKTVPHFCFWCTDKGNVNGKTWFVFGRYIMGKTWFWMSGASLGFSHWSHHSVPHQYSSPCGSMAMWDPHQWVDRSCDQHLHFICQSREQLHLIGPPLPPHTGPHQCPPLSPVGGGLGSKRVLFNSYIIWYKRTYESESTLLNLVF